MTRSLRRSGSLALLLGALAWAEVAGAAPASAATSAGRELNAAASAAAAEALPTAAEWGQFACATLLVLAAAVAWRKRIGPGLT
jgi:hypothetical protein